MQICETCGKEWPENYCPECGHSIGKPARPAVPPLLSEAQGPIPPLLPSSRASKPFPRWAIVVLILIGVTLFGAVFFHFMNQRFAFPAGYRNRPTAGWGVRMGEKEFEIADGRIDTFAGTNAFGNTPEAVRLAGRFSELFKAERARTFTHGFNLEILESTKGEFMTYCELHAQECAFIVHVPKLRKFDKSVFEKVDARKLLAQLAWMTAQDVLKAQGAGKPRMELAVGLRGISQYGPIMLGYFDSTATSPEDDLVKYLDDGAQTHFLWTFFAPEGQPRAH
jgi:hypothetical protein